jgi:hypothetical protein
MHHLGYPRTDQDRAAAPLASLEKFSFLDITMGTHEPTLLGFVTRTPKAKSRPRGLVLSERYTQSFKIFHSKYTADVREYFCTNF